MEIAALSVSRYHLYDIIWSNTNAFPHFPNGLDWTTAQTSKQLTRLDTSYQENWPADREVHLRLLLHPLNVVHGGHDVSHLLQVDAAAVVYVPHPQRSSVNAGRWVWDLTWRTTLVSASRLCTARYQEPSEIPWSPESCCRQNQKYEKCDRRNSRRCQQEIF